ncbi:MAG: T9SS type A sorting domain-containing protein [Candidatus Cloacimonetes bacterium]|nr:T9SS type A sorting domain-containing protein [Candidatus Cloacimonadota bacterium]
MKKQIRIYAAIFCVLLTAHCFCDSLDPSIGDQVGYSNLFEANESAPPNSCSTRDLIPPTFEITHAENGDITITVTSDEDLFTGWVEEKLIWSVGNFDNWSLNTRLERDPQNNLYAAVLLKEYSNSNNNFDMFILENNGEIEEEHTNWNGPGGNPLIINNPDENIYLGQPTISIEGAVDNDNYTYTFSTQASRWSTIYFGKIDPDGNVLISGEPIITGIDAWAYGIHPAIDSNNRIYIVWSDDMHDITYAYSDDGGDNWTEPISLCYDADNQMNKPDICCDSNDNVHVVWQHYISGVNYLSYMKIRPDGTVAIDESFLTQSNNQVWCPKIDVDEQNNVHITWARGGQTQGVAQYTKINGNLDADGASLTDNELTLIQDETIDPGSVRYPKCIVDDYENVHSIYEEGDYGLNTPKSFRYRKRNSAPLLRVVCPDDSVLFVEMTGSGTAWEGTFTPPMDGIYDVRVSASDVDGNTGIDNYQFEYPEVGIDDSDLPVAGFRLSNFPNPFNPTTTISFDLPAGNVGDAEIVIYNLRGQIIREYPVANNQSSIVWDGTDESNQPVGSGIYFYQITAGKDFSQTRKMLLMK